MTTLRCIRVALLLAAALPFSTRISAQTADSARVARIVREICPGAQVRLAVRDGDNVEGRCGAVTDGRLLVTAPGTRSDIRVASVDSVWMQRSYTTEATIVLAVLGAGVGYVATPPRANRECVEQQDCGKNQRRIVSGTTGAFVGALAGRFVGPLLLSWVRLAP